MFKTNSLYLIFCLSLNIFSCSSLIVKNQNNDNNILVDKIEVDDGLIFNLSGVESFGEPSVVRQIVNFSYENKNESLEIVLKHNKKQVTIYGISPLIGLIFTVEYNGQQIEVKQPKVKIDKLIPLMTLMNIYLTYLPKVKIQERFSKKVEIIDSTVARTILWNKKVLFSIHKKELINGWAKFIEINRPDKQYKVKITTLEVSANE